MDSEYKEVKFHQYCVTCKHEDKKEEESPCFECLDNAVNIHSCKPIKWEEKKKR